jgi:hypothetical protein
MHNNGLLVLESGHVRVFDYYDKKWKHRGLDIDGPQAGEELRSSNLPLIMQRWALPEFQIGDLHTSLQH